MTKDRLAKEFAIELTKLCKKFNFEIFANKYGSLSLGTEFPEDFEYIYTGNIDGDNVVFPEIELVRKE